MGKQDTVKRIKERVEEKEGIPPPQQRLIFGGKQMHDDKSASDYNRGYHLGHQSPSAGMNPSPRHCRESPAAMPPAAAGLALSRPLCVKDALFAARNLVLFCT